MWTQVTQDELLQLRITRAITCNNKASMYKLTNESTNGRKRMNNEMETFCFVRSSGYPRFVGDRWTRLQDLGVTNRASVLKCQAKLMLKKMPIIIPSVTVEHNVPARSGNRCEMRVDKRKRPCPPSSVEDLSKRMWTCYTQVGLHTKSLELTGDDHFPVTRAADLLFCMKV